MTVIAGANLSVGVDSLLSPVAPEQSSTGAGPAEQSLLSGRSDAYAAQRTGSLGSPNVFQRISDTNTEAQQKLADQRQTLNTDSITAEKPLGALNSKPLNAKDGMGEKDEEDDKGLAVGANVIWDPNIVSSQQQQQLGQQTQESVADGTAVVGNVFPSLSLVVDSERRENIPSLPSLSQLHPQNPPIPTLMINPPRGEYSQDSIMLPPPPASHGGGGMTGMDMFINTSGVLGLHSPIPPAAEQSDMSGQHQHPIQHHHQQGDAFGGMAYFDTRNAEPEAGHLHSSTAGDSSLESREQKTVQEGASVSSSSGPAPETIMPLAPMKALDNSNGSEGGAMAAPMSTLPSLNSLNFPQPQTNVPGWPAVPPVDPLINSAGSFQAPGQPGLPWPPSSADGAEAPGQLTQWIIAEGSAGPAMFDQDPRLGLMYPPGQSYSGLMEGAITEMRQDRNDGNGESWEEKKDDKRRDDYYYGAQEQQQAPLERQVQKRQKADGAVSENVGVDNSGSAELPSTIESSCEDDSNGSKVTTSMQSHQQANQNFHNQPASHHHPHAFYPPTPISSSSSSSTPASMPYFDKSHQHLNNMPMHGVYPHHPMYPPHPMLMVGSYPAQPFSEDLAHESHSTTSSLADPSSSQPPHHYPPHPMHYHHPLHYFPYTHPMQMDPHYLQDFVGGGGAHPGATPNQILPPMLGGQEFYPPNQNMQMNLISPPAPAEYPPHRRPPRRPRTSSSPPAAPVRDASPRRYLCQVCSKRFTRPSTLRTHMNSHTGERPFACTTVGCGWRFTVLSNLKRHMRICPNGGGSAGMQMQQSEAGDQQGGAFMERDEDWR
ncbi:hypothetical protein HDU97_008556 [Phlyctochytrium planicorne]|nr:hypothetical protein HDU97_008556 [Phlyctochytrium planicorne]